MLLTYHPKRLLTLAGAIFAACLLAAGAASARPDSEAVLSPVAFEVLDRPDPVRGADGRMHLSYEIEAVNQAPMDVTIQSIATRGGGKRIGPVLAGDGLAARTRLNAGGEGATLGPGQSGVVFVDAAYPAKRRTPRAIRHVISLSWPDAASGQTTSVRLVGVASRVGQGRAVLLDSPLRGGRWVAGSSCCTLQPHRGATLAIDGTIRVPERFAIDFVRLDSQGLLFQGPIDELSSYAFFGTPVHAAAAGRVVGVEDDLPEQVPGQLPAGATIQMAGGNHVVVDMGGGKYALYAHLKTGSVRVEVGQRVRAGQVLGLLGNSGNTDAPHLHFHVMDSPSPLQSNGLPYRFRAFRGQGKVTDPTALLEGGDPGIDRSALAGRHRGELPMDYQIVAFPKR